MKLILFYYWEHDDSIIKTDISLILFFMGMSDYNACSSNAKKYVKIDNKYLKKMVLV